MATGEALAAVAQTNKIAAQRATLQFITRTYQDLKRAISAWAAAGARILAPEMK